MPVSPTPKAAQELIDMQKAANEQYQISGTADIHHQ